MSRYLQQAIDSTRHRAKDICPPISQIKELYKISLIIKDFDKMAIVLKISMPFIQTSNTDSTFLIFYKTWHLL